MKNLIWGLLLSGGILTSCDQHTRTDGATAAVDTTAAEMLRQSDSMMNDVVLVAMPERVKAAAVVDSLLVDMTNNTKDTITTGAQYDIQMQTGNDWASILPTQSFIQIAYGLNPSESRRFEIRLWPDKITYAPGNYRVVKYYTKADTQGPDSTFAAFHVE